VKRRNALNLMVAAVLALSSHGQVSAQGGPAGAKSARLSGDVLKIAVLNDMSSLFSDMSGMGSVEAARMAIADFGGRIFDRPIELVFADHQNRPDVGTARAREWLDKDGVDMITDVPTSSIGIALAKLMNDRKRVYMNTGTGSKALTNEACTPYTVHYAYDTYALASGTARAVVKMGGKSWFFLAADYAFGRAMEEDASAVIRSLGGEVVGTVRHPLNTGDFSSFMLQAQRSKAQIIGLANAGADTTNAIKAAVEFGLTKQHTMAALLLFDNDIHGMGLAATQGMYLTTPWYWDLNEDTRKFGRRFFEKMKRMPSFDQAAVYSATLTYLKAVQAAGTDDADAVMTQLRKARINDMFVKNGYVRADGRMMKEMYLMQVKRPADSKYPWDYFELKSVIPAEEAFQPLSQSTCPLVKR
jgi:branched-chain amino acid transport system substrate-binding protein